jgi:hypothetical protein
MDAGQGNTHLEYAVGGRTGSVGTYLRRWGMQAAIGDRLRVHGSVVGRSDRTGEIVEIRGTAGEPPYLVRFDDGHTSLMFPGPDAVIERPRKKGRPKAK